MDETAIVRYITDTFPNVETATNFGYTFFFYGSDHRLPFATLASSDNDYDRVSNLDRPEVFRLNIGVSKETFRSLFGADAIHPAKYDFTMEDKIMPHPHYAAQHFVCVLNPGEATLIKVRELLAEAYELAARRKQKAPSRGEA